MTVQKKSLFRYIGKKRKRKEARLELLNDKNQSLVICSAQYSGSEQ